MEHMNDGVRSGPKRLSAYQAFTKANYDAARRSLEDSLAGESVPNALVVAEVARWWREAKAAKTPQKDPIST